MTRQLIYLDHAAATPMDPAVLAAMQPYYTAQFYNPSATYTAARSVATDIEVARASVAHWFGCRPAEVIFTAGGTEANNLAITGVMHQYPEGNIIVSAIEHESVLRPAANYDYRIVPVDNDGIIDIAALAKLIDDNTVLISIMYANNEIGTIQPLRDVGVLIEQVRKSRQNQQITRRDTKPLYLHSDACQAGNYLDLHTSRLQVDMMTINGGKVYGPKQSGALYVKSNVRLAPLIQGGGQEKGLRSGTENVAQIIGLSIALQKVQEIRKTETIRLQKLRNQFLNTLQVKFPNSMKNTLQVKCLPNIVSVTFAHCDNERLLIQLDERGFLAAAGSACTASDDKPSHVLAAIGLNDTAAQSTIRFSFGQSTRQSDLDKLISTLAELVPKL